MGTISFPRVPQPPVNPTKKENDDYVAKLADIMARFFKESEWLQNGNISSQNVAEIAGYIVGLTDLKSRDGDVGLSSSNDIPDPVRLWAGSTDKDTAPWRVYKSGKMVATGALIQSKDGSYPRIVMDPDGDFFGAYASATRSIIIGADLSGYPFQTFRDGSNEASINYVSGAGYKVTSDEDIDFTADDIYLNPINFTHLANWGELYNDSTNDTLQDSLDEKAYLNYVQSNFGVNLAFDTGTRNLKLFAANGSTLATVNIP